MGQRRVELLELVSQHGKIEVNELSRLLHASQVTVRKDLEYLTEKGILRRKRGYAMLKHPDDINYQMAFQYEEKEKIGKAASTLVKDGETIIVECGSTCALFAEEVLKHHKHITIITNSTYIAHFIQDKPNVEIILLGGNYQKHSQASVGHITKQYASQFSVDKIFVGTGGFNFKDGFTGNDITRTDTIKSMTKSAKQIILLADSKKFIHPGSVPFLKPEEVHQVITDQGLPEDVKAYFYEKNVHVQFV